MRICLFPYLPLQKGMAVFLNKIEFLFHKDTLCQVWLKLTQCFLRSFFLIYFHYFVIITSWKKGRGASVNKLEIPLPNELKMLWAMFRWNWSCASGADENVKNLKLRQRRQWTTDAFWSEKLISAFGSGELKCR